MAALMMCWGVLIVAADPLTLDQQSVVPGLVFGVQLTSGLIFAVMPTTNGKLNGTVPVTGLP
jgi:hypothetical protein